MTKLSDTQLVLLSAAAKNDGGSFLPLPTSISAPRMAIDKAIASLIKRDLAEESEVTDSTLAWRADDEVQFDVRITPAGRMAIGLSDETLAGNDPVGTPEPLAEKKQTKAALVLTLLQRGDGATLDELVSATGWLPHTTRAALTGMRKKNHNITKFKRDEITCYRIEMTA